MLKYSSTHQMQIFFLHLFQINSVPFFVSHRLIGDYKKRWIFVVFCRVHFSNYIRNRPNGESTKRIVDVCMIERVYIQQQKLQTVWILIENLGSALFE